jgi:hypothetical protein
VLRVENRWKVMAARQLSGVASLSVTAAYAALLASVSLTLTVLGPRAHDVAVDDMSTNLDNLAHGCLFTLAGSAFVSNGDDVFFWLPALVCLLAVGEMIWRGRGLLITFAVGHVVATLIVAAGLVAGIEAGWLRASVASASDVGVSYGAICVLGALTPSIPSRWRTAWIGWWLGTALVAARGGDFTVVGHVVALMLGMGMSLRLPRTSRWTSTRVALLLVGMVFGYVLLSGWSVFAPVGGVTGTVIALLVSRALCRPSVSAPWSTRTFPRASCSDRRRGQTRNHRVGDGPRKFWTKGDSLPASLRAAGAVGITPSV